jgi:AcrR family transcriptional regulator
VPRGSTKKDEPKPRRVGRPAGISASVQRSVLAAARDELMQFGYREFRMDRVAERASVHRSTLYRHWSTPAALARDAIVTWEIASIPVPRETGEWHEDLRAICVAFRDSLLAPEAIALVRTLIVANAVDPELRDALFEKWQRPEMVDIVARAQARGDVPSHLDPGQIIELIAGPFVLRAIVTMSPMDDAFVDFVAERIAAGIG